jgi:glycine cleavage system aminomethyltransferase T
MNTKILVSATGYTGEYGFEFFMDPEIAPAIWRLLLSVDSVIPAGLGARDSLRLEKGFPLYGHDITSKTNPVETNLERFVDYNKSFIGKEAITGKNIAKYCRRLMPFLCEGRRTARADFSVYFNDKAVGYVTSGVYSPVINKSIGLCLIDESAAYTGAIISCRKDKTEVKAVIVDLPFVE